MTMREFLKLWLSGQAERASEIIYYEPFSTPERASYWKKRFHDERNEYAKCRAEKEQLARENEHLHKVIQAKGKTTTRGDGVTRYAGSIEGHTLGKMIVRIKKTDDGMAEITNRTETIRYVVPFDHVKENLGGRDQACFFVENLTDHSIEIGKPTTNGWDG